MLASAQQRASPRLMAGGAAFAVVLLIVLLFPSGGKDTSGVHRQLKKWAAPMLNGRARQCQLDFVAYEPSEWEEEWRVNSEEYQIGTCKRMAKQKDLVDAWMEPMNASFSRNAIPSELPAFQDTKVFSHYIHRYSCSGQEVRTPIEPLVGLLRHPTSGKFCRRAERPEFMDTAHDPPIDQRNWRKYCADNPNEDCEKTVSVKRRTIENKGYMVIQPLSQEAIAALYPGRKYLFDLGTGRFSSGSLPWFMNIFGEKGIVFDEIYGWELTPIPDDVYWNEWPEDLSHKMHFRNVPCSVEPDDPRNPFNIMRRIYKPGDYVAFKLDIDNEPIEQALLKQLDDSVIEMIAEFFTEIHFDIPEMRGSFGQNLKIKLPEVINELQGFRTRGLRVHYWP